jgi:hypothetical protein
MKTRLLSALLFCASTLIAQKSDTLQITSENINTKVLREGTSRYLVYFKMKKDSVRTQTQFWTRTIKRTDYIGKPAIEITQEWEDKDSIMHIVKSILMQQLCSLCIIKPGGMCKHLEHLLLNLSILL